MSTRRIERIADGFGALEGPTIDGKGRLLVGDVARGGVHLIDPVGRTTTVIPERKSVGGICLHADGGFVASGTSVIHHRQGAVRTLLSLSDLPDRDRAPAVGFNDLGADTAGRLLAGVLRRDADGTYHPGEMLRISGPGQFEIVHDDIHPNGVALSPEGDLLYLADTFRRRVLVLDATDDRATVIGELSTALVDGLPDGLAVDTAGGVWAAFYNGACIARIDPLTGVDGIVPMPVPKTLSLCFVGPGSSSLYVVTGSGATPPNETGGVYVVDTAFTGAPVPVATV